MNSVITISNQVFKFFVNNQKEKVYIVFVPSSQCRLSQKVLSNSTEENKGTQVRVIAILNRLSIVGTMKSYLEP